MLFLIAGIFLLSCSDPVEKPVLLPGHYTNSYWDWLRVFSPSVTKDKNIFKMWYSGQSSETEPPSIGYAISTNGYLWIKHSDNPVLELNPILLWEKKGSPRLR
jgi:hypothetical protein